MIQPRRIGTKNAAPQMRAEYGPHIKVILGHVPNGLLLDKGVYRATVFLHKLADYLMSDVYAERSAKGLARKAKSIEKRSEK